MIITFKSGLGYVYYVIDHNLEHLPRCERTLTARTHCFCEICNQAQFWGFCTFTTSTLCFSKKFFCVNFIYCNFGLLTNLDYSILFLVLRGIRAKLLALFPTSKTKWQCFENEDIFTFSNNFLMFQLLYLFYFL